MQKILFLSLLNLFLLFPIFTLLEAQTYCAGDQISIAHQNQEHVVGAGSGDYETGDVFRLADHNGDLNGGNYSIIFIDMSASWCVPCVNVAPYIDELEDEYSGYGVVFLTSLAEPNEPYSFLDWQNLGIEGIPLILDGDQSSESFYNLFHNSWNAYPTFVVIDHTLTVRAKPSSIGSNFNTNSCDGNNSLINGWTGGSTSSFLDQLIEECGALCESTQSELLGDINQDESLNIFDIIILVEYVLDGGYVYYGDINQDEAIDVMDVVALVNLILEL